MLGTLCEKWPYIKVRVLAIGMQDQMLPAESRMKAPGFQSGEMQEVYGNKKIKTTKISFADMAARAKAGIDTSIKGV